MIRARHVLAGFVALVLALASVAGGRPGSRHGQGRRARVRHGQLGAGRHQAPRPGQGARLHPRGPGLRQRRRRPTSRSRARRSMRSSTTTLWVSRQRTDGQMLTFVPFSSTVGALMVPPDSGHREPRRPQGQEGRRRRRPDRQELAADPGPRGQAPRHGPRGRGRAGLRRAAAPEREGRWTASSMRSSTTGISPPGSRARATSSWSGSRRRSASSGSRACRRSSATCSTSRSPMPTPS